MNETVYNETLTEREASWDMKDEHADLENWVVHYMRVIFLIFGYVIFIFFLFLFILWIICLCLIIGKQFGHGSSISSPAQVWRQGTLIHAMSHVPYSNFVFREAQDCPICLETFVATSNVIQLKCSKYNIYHIDCIKGYI